MTIELIDYPLFDTTVMSENQALLDEMASEYVTTLDGADPQIERFLFGYVPVAVFDRIFAGIAGEDLAGSMWLIHLSGYFGGRWLRGEIGAAQPDALLNAVSMTADEAGFQATMSRAQQSLDAAAADDAACLEHARASLFDQPPAAEGGEPVPGLTDSFGYNLGYMLEILASSPEGLTAGPEYQIECSGLFGCAYASPRLAVLQALADVQAAISMGEEPYSALAAELLPIQDAAEPRGRSVWSSGLSVQGFPQKSYDQLLDVSSSFLETVQATALTMAAATTLQDPDQARIGAVANAAMTVWLSAYRVGLLDGEGTLELPELTVS